jgi:hypothetical protein
MAKIKLEDRTIHKKSMNIINAANIYLDSLPAGVGVSVRHVYYKLVGTYFPNTNEQYAKFTTLMRNARMAGLVDWDRIVDNTRGLTMQTTWDHPQQLFNALVPSWRMDLWTTQPTRVVVAYEKDAMTPIIAAPCLDLRVPYVSLRGFSSITEIRNMADTFKRWQQRGQDVTILFLGDLDPSGIEIPKKLAEYLELFCGFQVPVVRIGVTKDQIDELDMTHTKMTVKRTDTRAPAFKAEHGHWAYELDTLPYDYVQTLVRDAIQGYINKPLWAAAEAKQRAGRVVIDAALYAISDTPGLDMRLENV